MSTEKKPKHGTNDAWREGIKDRIVVSTEKTRPKLVAPLRRVVKSELWWTGNPHQAVNLQGNHHFRIELLECGHTEDFGIRTAKRRRCNQCLWE